MITCGGRSSESGFQGAAAPTSGTLDPHGGARRATPLSVWHYGHTLLVVALLRHAGGGASSGYSPLVMLPILWMAMYASRTQLRLAIVATAVTFLAPLIFVGPPLYPISGWRGSVLWVVIGLLSGSAIQKLVDQSRQRTADLAALGAVTRALTAGADPRPELCSAAQVVTGAAFAVLVEPHADGTLVATAGTDGVDLGSTP